MTATSLTVSAPAAVAPRPPRALIDYDFRSAVASPPRHRLALWLMLALVLAVAAWLGLAKVDMVITANGKIVTSGGDIVVQALETSVVHSVNVRMGQKVKAGEVLARLDPTFTQADEAELVAKLQNLRATYDRLDAELAGGLYTPADPNPDELTQFDIFGKRQSEFAARVESFERKVKQLQADLEAHGFEAEGLAQEAKLVGEQESMYQQLVAGSLSSKLKLLDMSQRLVQVESRLSTNRGEQQKLLQQIGEAMAERGAFVAEWKRKLAEQLSQTRSEHDGTAARLSKARLRHELAVMRAPVDATVLEVAPRPAGAVVREAETLLRLVPADEPLLAQVQIDTRDVARIHLGDRITLKFEALPWQQYGLASGVLKSLTPDTVTDPNERESAEDMVSPEMKNQARQSPIHYRARIELTETNFRNLPDGFALMPGLRLVGDIKVGRRSVLDYILNPITRVIDESLREP
jgi:HlyD family secretion protein